MTRPLFLCLVCMMLVGCHRAELAMPEIFPETSGAWHRTAIGELRAAETPDAVPRASVERIRTAAYEGPGKLDARVYQMSSAAVALDVVQRWRAAPDSVFFYADRFFVVVKWESAERKALHDFVGGLEKRLNRKP